MKLVHITDTHCGGAHPEKIARSFEFFEEQLWSDSGSPAYMPNLVYFTGDLTDRPLNVHSEYLKPFLKFVKAAQCQLVLLQGTLSHEPLGTIQNLADMSDGKLSIITSPFDQINVGGFDIRGIPGLSRPLIAKWCREAEIQIDGFDDPTEALREILRRIAKTWTGGLKVLGGHLTIIDSKTASGQTMTGGDIALSVGDLLLAGADLCPLGHIHLHQILRAFNPHISYGGSPQPCNYGELDHKGFSVFVTPGNGELVSLTRVPMPHRPMVKVELEFDGTQLPDGTWNYDSLDSDIDIELSDKEVKCVYTIPREIAATVDDAYIRVLFAKHGIDLAVVERVIKTEARERIEGITTMQTTAQQYQAVCAARGVEVRPGAIAKADLIDQQGVAV